MTLLRTWMACLLALMVLPALGARPPRRTTHWDALEASKATIGKIVVEVVDVFDVTIPGENTRLGRTANRLHATTHDAVIRRVLLFKEGDRVRARVIYETERLLRAQSFLKDAHIVPVVQPDGLVVAEVRVRDAWTTQVNAGFSSVGGQRAMNMGLDEKNFAGLGKSVALDFSKDYQRSTWGVTYLDPQFLGSRWNLMVQDQYLSDGMARQFSLGLPFYALETPWSTSLAMSQKRTGLYLYDRGLQIYQAPFAQNEVQWTGAGAFAKDGDRVWRGGLLLDRQDTRYGAFTQTGPADPLLAPVVADRRLRGAALTLATQKDAFEVFVDLLGMDTPEDYNQAWNGSLALGTYSRALGSTATEPFFLFQGTDGWSSSSDDLGLLTLAASGRKPATGLENAQVNLAVVQYWKLTPNQILAGLAAVDMGRRLDPENWYYLGGDQGMRGFPNELHPGDARWLVSAEYRYLTQQRWWGLVRLGYDAFVDMGAIREMNGQGWSKNYTDVGIGLRLGNLKSSLGRVILLSVAAPLNREPYQSRLQFTIGNTMRF